MRLGRRLLLCLHAPAAHARTRTRQEYLQDYGDAEARALGQALIEKESGAGLSDSAKRLLARKMVKVKAGEHDVYI
jgi:hypothetical protein